MNLSKKHDSRCWKKWAEAGAVAIGNAIVTNMGHGKRLVRFTKPMSVKAAVASMERAGCRPATMQELLSETDLLGETVIVDPITITDPHFPTVPYLYLQDSKVELSFRPDDEWGHHRFLFSRTE